MYVCVFFTVKPVILLSRHPPRVHIKDVPTRYYLSIHDIIVSLKTNWLCHGFVTTEDTELGREIYTRGMYVGFCTYIRA